jgi:8-oxo-dGTP pyrophosphatase MutT (NUDIX family)
MSFEKLDSEERYSGLIASVRVERFRHDDGEVVQREVIGHPGAVAVVAHDDEHVWLVRQPREAAGEEALLEIPAGKLDVEGEPPLETAKRELAEEIGKAAERWTELGSFYTSPGFTDEVIWLFVATELTDVERPEVDEEERIQIIPWPLADLDAAIDECRDAKSLIGLLKFARMRERAG